MGFVTSGPPLHLVLALAKRFGCHEFVETGTSHGSTAVWASAFFQTVFTIERSEALYRKVSREFEHLRNVRFLLGSSGDRLPEVVSQLHPPAVFWLDAHCCDRATEATDIECPLIDEINIINSGGADHFILIDDARLFTSKLPSQPNVDHWPGIANVIDALNAGPAERYTVIDGDVIVSVPRPAADEIWDFFRKDPARVWGRAEQAAVMVARGTDALVDLISRRRS